MSASWPSETVEACLERLRLPSGGGLNARDYQPAGAYPVVDQGRGLIAGWTDDHTRVITEPLPVIVFGDHSRTFKFVDFPFVRGADGTQILRPRVEIDPRYFYFACRAVDLPSRGYNRHFGLLKEQSILLPDRDEQIKIGRVLQQSEALTRHGDAQIDVTRELKQAALADLFSGETVGGGQPTSAVDAAPHGWESVAIGDLGQVVTGTTPPTRDEANYASGTVPFVTPGDIYHGCAVTDTAKTLSDQGAALARPIPIESTCVVCIGSTIGKVGITATAQSATNQQINTVIPSEDYHPRFVFHLLTHWSEQIRSEASPSPVPILSKGAFERIEVYVTADADKQREIAQILDSIDRRVALLGQKRAATERLLLALSHQLLSGETRVDDLDLDALPALAANVR